MFPSARRGSSPLGDRQSTHVAPGDLRQYVCFSSTAPSHPPPTIELEDEPPFRRSEERRAAAQSLARVLFFLPM